MARWMRALRLRWDRGLSDLLESFATRMGNVVRRRPKFVAGFTPWTDYAGQGIGSCSNGALRSGDRIPSFPNIRRRRLMTRLSFQRGIRRLPNRPERILRRTQAPAKAARLKPPTRFPGLERSFSI